MARLPENAPTDLAPTLGAPTSLMTGDPVDRGFGRAIVVGSVIGVLVWGAVLALTVKLANPDAVTGDILAIAAWVGVWGGVFLGGTVSVGLWSHKHH